MNKKFKIILPLLIMGASLTACTGLEGENSIHFYEASTWEATDIYLETLDYHIDSLKFVISVVDHRIDDEFCYNYNHATFSKDKPVKEVDQYFMLSVYLNDEKVNDQEGCQLFGYTYDVFMEVYWEDSDSAFYDIYGNLQRVKKDEYFAGYLYVSISEEDYERQLIHLYRVD
ncbi:MAG: hypothetical protein LUB56_01180 [Coprobacillus sp.]|nr:hypothetical protein [Coprobacillus sp.]